VSVLQACPRCGAMVRPDAAWCSLCFARFDTADGTVGTDPHERPGELLDAAQSRQLDPLDWSDGPVEVDPLTAPIDQLLDAPAPPAAAPTLAGPVWRDAQSAPESAPEPAPEPEPDAPPTTASDADLATMLAMLAAEHRQQDALSPWADRLGDRTTRFVVMVGGMLLLSVVLFGLLSVVSFLG